MARDGHTCGQAAGRKGRPTKGTQHEKNKSFSTALTAVLPLPLSPIDPLSTNPEWEPFLLHRRARPRLHAVVAAQHVRYVVQPVQQQGIRLPLV
nr:unnamed protein product [Haemonchus contortus]